MAWSFVRIGAVGCSTGLSIQTLQELCWLSLCVPPLPLVFLYTVLVLCYLLPSLLAPSILFYPVFFSASSLLKAPSGGFSYSGFQNSSQSQFSYSLSQGSRTRNPSSDVNEALYSLDRVLQGESAAYRHEGTACSSWVCFVRHIPFCHLRSCFSTTLVPKCLGLI